MSGHTPGPWVLEENDDGHLIRMGTAVTNRGRHEAHHVLDYDHVVGSEDGDGSQFEEAEANARLIAAAPELLAAAKDIWDTTAQSGPINDYDIQAFDRLKAAIAKAEGRTP